MKAVLETLIPGLDYQFLLDGFLLEDFVVSLDAVDSEVGVYHLEPLAVDLFVRVGSGRVIAPRNCSLASYFPSDKHGLGGYDSEESI